MAWYKGQLLSQTVLCGLLYHHVEQEYISVPDPDTLLEQHRLVAHLLLQYAIIYRQCIDLAYTELAKGNIREGEDCMLDHADMPLQSCETISATGACVRETIDSVRQCVTGDVWTDQLLYRLSCRAVSVLRFAQVRLTNGGYCGSLALRGQGRRC